MDKPNIILVTVDTLRCDALKCMGSDWAHSPHLDRLAGEGVLFTQAHSSSPVCMPARCSLMSGLHTPLHGCIENGVDRREDMPFITDRLEEGGYWNIMVGKTHFGAVPDSFHVQKVLNGEKGSDKDDFYADFIRSKGYSRSSGYPNPIPEDLFVDAYCVDTTIIEIEKAASGDKPFFAFCSLLSPHGPIDPPKPWDTLYDNIDLPGINYRPDEIEGHPTHLRRLVGTLDSTPAVPEKSHYEKSPFAGLDEARGNTAESQSPEEIEKFRKLYYGLAAYCDNQIGRLIEFLDEKDLRKNTLVIFTSDHGQQFFDHGFNDKHNYFDSSWHIPLIISQPGTLPRGEKRDFAIWNDISATILTAAGCDASRIQGFDLCRSLKENSPAPRNHAVATLYKSAALATEKWKLEYYFEEEEGRLYDRKEDPEEQKNLYDDPRCRELRDELRLALIEWRADITDVDYLIGHTGGGGPVARRIAEHTRRMKGCESEERLNRRVKEIEKKYT